MGWSFNASGFGLVIFSLAFLCIGGIFYNNLSTSGYTNGGTPYAEATTCLTINCPAFGQTAATPVIICSTPTVCQVSKPSFLNQASPWTYLITGDFSGFTASFTNTASSPGINAFSLCNTYQSGTTYTYLHCTSMSTDLAGPPNQQFPIVSCSLRNPATAQSIGFNITTNGAPYATPNISNLSQWTVIGCQPANNVNTNPNNQTGAITFLADYGGKNTSITLTRFRPGLTDLFGSSGTGITFVTFIGWVISIILFVMSFGVGFTANLGLFGGNSAGGGFSSNAQGTRFAQVTSLALIIFLPLYSEFGTWILALGPKFGLDIFVTAIVLMIFFLGIWIQTTSGTLGS